MKDETEDFFVPFLLLNKFISDEQICANTIPTTITPNSNVNKIKSQLNTTSFNTRT